MADIKYFPTRPSNDREFKIERRAKDCLVTMVLLKYSKPEAFARFYPEYTCGDGIRESDLFKLTDTGKKYCNMFFDQEDNKNFLVSYRATLKSYLEDRSVTVLEAESKTISEDRIDSSLNTLIMQAVKRIERGEELDNDTFKLFMELFKKLGKFSEEGTVVEPPKRYLPVRCNECSYKQFIDEQVKLGNIEETND